MRKKNRMWWCVRLSVQGEALDELMSVLEDMGTLGASTEEGGREAAVVAYWPYDLPLGEVIKRLEGLGRRKGTGPGGGHWRVLGVEILQEEPWEDSWREFFIPKRVSPRIVVCPPWRKVRIRRGSQVVEINPGRAFGTGLHETTRMCLRWVDEILSGSSLPPRALDLGTGSGILAIAMAKLGVQEVWAVDHDPVAVVEARANAKANGVDQKVRVLQGDLGAVGGIGFPLVVANLTAKSLGEMAPVLGEVVEMGGLLVASGMLKEQVGWVAKAFKVFGFKNRGYRKMGQWRSVLLERS